MAAIAKDDIPAYGAEEFEFGAYTIRVQVERDEDMGEPWKEHDGHGPVSDWETRDKLPGERVLCEDRRQKRFYDFAAAVKIARRDGWGSQGDDGLKPGAKAARAAEKDYEFLRRWCNDDWYWAGVIVKVERDGEAVGEDSLCGIESDGDYWRECAAEMASGIIESHERQRSETWRAALREARERKYWAQRDTATVQS